MKNIVRAGFIGLNPDSHWAATAHVPTLKSLADKYTIQDAVALHELLDAIEQSAPS